MELLILTALLISPFVVMVISYFDTKHKTEKEMKYYKNYPHQRHGIFD